MSIKAHLADSEGVKFLLVSLAKTGSFDYFFSLTIESFSSPSIAAILDVAKLHSFVCSK